MTSGRDIYGRKPTSRSRGKTQQRIMDLQHAPDTLPGAEEVLEDAPAGSIAEAVREFHRSWVSQQPVTSRRAYERGLVFLLRDLAADGPAPTEAVGTLSEERFALHISWRMAEGLDHPGELLRCGVQLARFMEWLDEQGHQGFAGTRDGLRAVAAAAAERASKDAH